LAAHVAAEAEEAAVAADAARERPLERLQPVYPLVRAQLRELLKPRGAVVRVRLAELLRLGRPVDAAAACSVGRAARSRIRT